MCSRSKVESLWQVQMLRPNGFGGAQNFTPGTDRGVSGTIRSKPGRRMHDRDVKAPSERAKLAGACATGQWLRRIVEGFLAGLHCCSRHNFSFRIASPHSPTA